jgi:hypothetical protein
MGITGTDVSKEAADMVLAGLGPSLAEFQIQAPAWGATPISPFIIASVLIMPLGGAGCKLGWCKTVNARMLTSRVVVETPGFDDLAGLL